MGSAATTALVLAASGCLDIPAAPVDAAHATDAGGGDQLAGVSVFALAQPAQTPCVTDLGDPLPENCKVIVNGPHYTVEFEYGAGRPKLPKVVSVPPAAVNLLGSATGFPAEAGIGAAFYTPPGDLPTSASTNAFAPSSGTDGFTFDSHVSIDAIGKAAVTVTSTWNTTDRNVCGADLGSPGDTVTVITAFTFYPDGRIVKSDRISPVELSTDVGCDYITTYVTLAGPPMPEVAWNIVGGPTGREQYDSLTTAPGGYPAPNGYDACLYNPADALGPQAIVFSRPDTPYQGVRIHNFPNTSSGTIGFVHDWRRGGTGAGNQPPGIEPPLLATTVLWVGSHTATCAALTEDQVVGLMPSGWEFLHPLGAYHALAGAPSYTMDPGLPAHSALQFDLTTTALDVRLGGTPLVAGTDYLAQRAGDLWTLYVDRPIDAVLSIGPAS